MSYLAVNCELTFPANRDRGGKQLKSLSSFTVERSWQNLTNTASVVIAKHLYLVDKRVFELLKSGDPVIIKAGYNGSYWEEFTGYITEVQDDLPVKLTCEDNMYVLKRTPCHCSYGSVKLEELLKAILPSQFKVDAIDVTLGSVLFKNYTVSKALQDLKDKMGIYCYFVGDTLVAGKIYQDNTTGQKVKYVFGRNIIENSLRYRRKDDSRIKVTMTSYRSSGKKLKVTVGDDDGQEMKLVATNINTEADLEVLAKKELDRLKIDGYQGTITSYGLPYVDHGYSAEVVDYENEDRSGIYYVDSVTVSLNNSGAYRRVVKLGPKAAA